jgi:hypothetical protein
MARGLTLMGAAPAAVERHQAIPVNTVPTMPADPALVRVLANMVLRIQAEVQHVY